MNIINPSNSICNASKYQQTNAAISISDKKATMQADHFIKSSDSLVPEPYTKETSKDITRVNTTSTVPDIDLDALTEDQIKLYFGYEVDHTGKTTYLPIIHASDDVKKAWIASIDQIELAGDGPMGNIMDMKDAMATGCGDFRGNSDTSIGLRMNTEDFFNSIKITIDESLTGKYTYSTGPNIHGIIDGQKEYANKVQKFYDLFEAFYKGYSKQQ